MEKMQVVRNELRILQVNKLYRPWIGGVETAAEDCAEYLSTQNGVSIVNLVCQPQGRRRIDIVNGVKTYRAASWGMFAGMPLSLDFFLLFRRLAKTADLIILHHPFPLAFLAYRYLGSGRRAVVWYHSDIVKQKLLKIPFMPAIRFVLRKAARIIVSNKSIVMRSEVLREVSDRCEVIYFGIDQAKFASSSKIENTARLLRKQYGNPLILSVGRLVYYKGYQYLIDAMAEVPEAHLLIIGRGPLHGKLKQSITKKRLENRVQIIEPVEDLIPYYRACDVFALPSCEPSEVFGIVQIEAMACGKPVVNTALPTGVPEVSLDGRTGRTVPPKDASALAAALRDLLENKEEYNRLSQNAINEVSARFTKERFFASLDATLLPKDLSA